ncbi:competence protein CoiA family protein [Streptomyces sp. Edi2]|uniref:competence protein CoiA family protein n=1 Tax=Streptomyces sp. Edi2 TaxID=3162528 RepID=UPI0033063BE1
MPFTALHPEAGRIDATRPDLAEGITWAQLHRTRPQVPLTCPDCAWTMHARLSPLKLRYFAHDPGRPESCTLAGESLEHHLIKLQITCAIRAADWHADLEVAAPDGSWRADVLAAAPDGSARTAWEVQLSPNTEDELWARTNRYSDAGIAVCWVTNRDNAPWMGRLPSARLRPGHNHGHWTVDDGLGDFSFTQAGWTTTPVPLEQFVDQVNRRLLTSHPVIERYHLIHRSSDNQRVRRRQLWAPAGASRDQDRHDAMCRRQEARAREQTEQRQAREAADNQRKDARRAEWSAARQAEIERWRRAREAPAQQREAERAERQHQQRLAAEQRRAQLAEDKQRGHRWWQELTEPQIHDFMNAVARHLRQHDTRPHIPVQEINDHRELGYGIPVFALGRFHHLRGIARPCPDLVASTPQLRSGTTQIYVRNTHEAQLLADAGVAADRIHRFNLPDHEPTTPS